MSKQGTVKEQIASLCTDMQWLKKQFDNHLAHHWAFTVALLSAIIAEAIGFIVLVAKHVF
jgi:hypothetical protein